MQVDIERGRTSTPAPTVAVNGRTIPQAAIAREVQHHPASSAEESQHAAVRALVVRELLLQEVERLGIKATPNTDDAGRRETTESASIRALIACEVGVPEPEPEELRRYYDAHRARFRARDLFEASHILVAARTADPDAYALARERADAIARELAASPERFGDLARGHSDCASAGEGGRLGQVALGEVTPEFAEALEGLVEGETTAAPVATRYGFHLIRLERRLPGALMPFDAAAPLIAGYLKERSGRTATAQFIARLVSAADIEGIDMAGAEAYRVSPQ